MNENIKGKLIEAVREVNKTLKSYEPGGYLSAQRIPATGDYPNQEVALSFEQWIEIRLNNEIFFNIPELSNYVMLFSGYLFVVTNVTDKDDIKRRFKEVEVSVTNSPEHYVGMGQWENDLNEVRQIIGCNSFKFNYSQKKTKVE